MELLESLALGSVAMPTFSVVRELTVGDLQESERQVPSIARIRHAHHQLAMLVAEGRKGVEIASMTGYTPTRISQLKNDPTFKDLVAYYREQRDAVSLGVQERLAQLGMEAADILHERMLEAPNGFGNRELKEIMMESLDRSSAPSKRPSGGAVVNIKFVDSTPMLELKAEKVS